MLRLSFVKRPYQHLCLVLWALFLFTWLIISFQGDSPSSAEGYFSAAGIHPRWARYSQQEILDRDGLPTETTALEVPHPRLYQRPLPTHASEPDFPNIPIALRLPADDGSHITEEEVEQYLTSIWDLGDNMFYRTECPGQGGMPRRYGVLEEAANNHHTSEVKYFFALDLYEVKPLLPRLMGTLVHVVKILGPTKCAVSIVEGRSKDGTYAILLSLKDKLESIGTRVYLDQSSIDPHAKGVDRIGALSILRNMALAPLIDGSKTATGPPIYNRDTIVTFINDIAVCPEDIYELLFQHIHQSAHQTCAMDWVHGGNLFYDSWVSRSMSGDLFFEVPQDVSFAFADNMFWDHPPTKKKFKEMQPFQVYSCWGGMITLSSGPFIDSQIEFRNSTKAECYAGEPTTLAKDLWKLGYGKILTVPAVNVAYNSHEGARVKKRRGWVHQNVDTSKTEKEWRDDGKGTELIEWRVKPPGQVKCLPSWGVGTWTEP